MQQKTERETTNQLDKRRRGGRLAHSWGGDLSSREDPRAGVMDERRWLIHHTG